MSVFFMGSLYKNMEPKRGDCSAVSTDFWLSESEKIDPDESIEEQNHRVNIVDYFGNVLASELTINDSINKLRHTEVFHKVKDPAEFVSRISNDNDKFEELKHKYNINGYFILDCSDLHPAHIKSGNADTDTFTIGAKIEVYEDQPTINLRLNLLSYHFVLTESKGDDPYEGLLLMETVPVPKIDQKVLKFRLTLNSQSSVNFNTLDELLRIERQLGHNCVPDVLLEKLEEIARGFIKKEFGKDLCPYFKAKSFSDVLALFYFPTEPGLFYCLNKYHSLDPNAPGYVHDFCKDWGLDFKKEDTKDVNLFFEHFKIPKSIRKAFLGDPKALFHYRLFKEAGFKDLNLIQNKLIYKEPSLQTSQDESDLIEVNLAKPSFYWDFREIAKYFLEDLHCSESKALRLLFCGDALFRYDTVHMILQNKHRFNEEQIKQILKHGLRRELHDYLSGEIEKMGKENRVFDIDQKYFDLYEMEIDDYKFKLARDSHTLVSLGSLLNICVGSYDDHVELGKCLIVYIEKDEEPVGCIEIRNFKTKSEKFNKEHYVQQARGKYNANFDVPIKPVFEKWLEKTKLIFTGNHF